MKNGFIIVFGNINEGFSFIGPFISFDEASDYADKVGGITWISGISIPKKVILPGEQEI